MENFYTIMTNAGKKKIINAATNNAKINLKRIILGDSNGQYYEPNPSQTSLKRKVWEGNIDRITTSNSPGWINLEAIVPSNIGGFYIRELGIVDEDGTLMAVGKYPETYKPTTSDNSFKELYINAIIDVTNTETINVTLDPNVTLVTKKYVDDRLGEIKLTPGPQGPAGPPGKDGTSVNILGSKDSVDLLPATGQPGDGWLVQGDLYVWDTINRRWINAGSIKGPQGERGATGPQGSPGAKGDRGERGVTGSQGPQGDRGPQGSQGLQGERGATGPQGEQGPWGPIGPAGPRGAKGKDGTFDSSTQFPSLNTNNKTVLGAVNELKSQIGNITIKVVQ